MLAIFDPLRGFSFLSLCLRLLLALACGGVVGYGRSKKNQVAGLRTYMIISIGAALSVLVTMYDYEMLCTQWADVVAEVGQKFDASRLASQVITGIGFLGAGMIIKAAHQQVRGLTTAAGLLTTVGMGLAAGAGFFELALLSLLFSAVVLNLMSPLEILYKRRMRNITLNVEFRSVEDITYVVDVVKAHRAEIYEVDVEQATLTATKKPSAIFILQLSRENPSHSSMLSTVAELPCVYSVQELVS